ncbi:hypothetical protein DVS77_02445 [Mycolicibacterium moriokaense]|nr:hypothetical protein DVS77_02445 [Mycolicibacterium moriokaense]
MTTSTRTTRSRIVYAAMLAGAVAVLAVPTVEFTAVATAQPASDTWDLDEYEKCMNAFPYDGETTTWQLIEDQKDYCCRETGGVVDPGQEPEHCRAPSGDTKGSRQLPGGVRVPSDLAVVTQEPSAPIHGASDIATAQTLTQAPG